MTKIEWCDWSISACRCCEIGCNFCYAKKLCRRIPMMQSAIWLKQNNIPYKHLSKDERLKLYRTTPKWCEDCYIFKPHPHLEELDKLNPTQKPKKIFIDSLWDWNSPGIKVEWCREIIDKMRECRQHTFMILSKNPIGFLRYPFPNNVWLGTSIMEGNIKGRLHLNDLWFCNDNSLKFVSIEPLHGSIKDCVDELKNMDWIIVGAETGNRKNKIKPERVWIQEIIDHSRRYKIPLFLKDNLNWGEVIREFPEG